MKESLFFFKSNKILRSNHAKNSKIIDKTKPTMIRLEELFIVTVGGK